MAIRTVLIEDHKGVATAVAAHLSKDPDFEVLEVFFNLQDALASSLLPEASLVVLDARLGEGSGSLRANVLAIRKAASGVPIVVLSAHDTDDYVRQAFAAGVNGYCFKTQAWDKYIDDFRRVAQGESVWPRRKDLLVRDFAGTDVALTRREREIVEAICDGLSNREIAGRLLMAPPTVKLHVSSVIRKLGVTSREEVVEWMASTGGTFAG